MTYETQRDTVGRKPVTIVEIDLDKCGNVIGGGLLSPQNGTCTSSATGDSKCYNTRKTCRDPANFTNTDTFTAYFSDRLIPGENYIPCIESTKLAPTVITPGQPFNKRANITITFHDFPHHDRGVDPYVADRTYTPENQGTYFGKLLSRNPYYQGRALRLKTGYVADPFDTADLQTQNYVIEKITGPDKKGRVTIVAKDILKLSDDERGQCPVANSAKLAAGITSAATTLTLYSGDEADFWEPVWLGNGGFDDTSEWLYLTSPEAVTIANGIATWNGLGSYAQLYQTDLNIIAGVTYKVTCDITAIGSPSASLRINDNPQFPTIGSTVGTHELIWTPSNSGLFRLYIDTYSAVLSIDNVKIERVSEYIRIGDEIIYAPYSGRAAGSPALPYEFSSLTRGAFNTTAAAHSADDAVQNCKYISSVNVRDIVEDLLVNYAGIAKSFIPSADWDAEESQWLSGSNLTRLIAEPTGVKTLLDELSEQVMIYIWWDSVNQEVKFKAIAPPDTPTVTLDEDGHILDDLDVKVEVDDRKSRILVYYNPRSPINAKEPKDFDSVYGLIDTNKESADQYGDIRLKQIFGSWITSDSLALQTASRTKNQFENSPVKVIFTVDAKDSTNVTGDVINISTRKYQEEDGSNRITPFQIVSVEEITKKAPGTHFRFTAMKTQFSGRYAKIMTAGANDYSSATTTEKDNGGYIITAGQSFFSDGGEAYKIA